MNNQYIWAVAVTVAFNLGTLWGWYLCSDSKKFWRKQLDEINHQTTKVNE